jgi:hypothetical protein
MNHFLRCCQGLVAMTSLTLVLSANAQAAEQRSPKRSTPPPANQSWCIESLCLGQPDSVLRPYAARAIAPSPVGTCQQPLSRYAISRTDGALEAAVDKTGKIVELERSYNDPVTGAQFSQMARESSRKLTAPVQSQTAKDHRTVVRLRNASTGGEAELVHAPSQPIPLSVTLTAEVAPEACVAPTSGELHLAPVKPLPLMKR